jgi:hypothetical protein
MSGVTIPSTDGGTLSRVGIQFDDDVARDYSGWTSTE